MGPIRFWINDEPVEESEVPPNTTLLNYIRWNLALSGTKEGCAEGDCGACTVAILDGAGTDHAGYRAVNSCLLLLPMLHGKRVYTVEGLRAGGHYHPVQISLADAQGSQCGYCTPGIIMSMFEACYRDDLDAPWKLDDQLCGNLCRCTGYRPIRDATRAIAGTRPADPFLDRLSMAEEEASVGLHYEARGQRFHAPRSWEELDQVLASVAPSSVRYVCGATDLGLEVTKRGATFPCLVSVEHLPGLRDLHRDGASWSMGAAVPLAEIEAATEEHLPVMARMLRFFGARQIKNCGTLGGNLCNASPIGDTPPVFLALDATVVARSPAGERRIPIDDFFLDYRKTALAPGEVLVRVELETPPAGTLLGAYKVSKRRELDISAVCAAMGVGLAEDGTVVHARIAYGGMAATPCRAANAEAVLVGAPWSAETIERAANALTRDFTPMDDHRGSAWYRSTVARNLLIAFFEETRAEPYVHLPDRPVCTAILEVQP